MTKGQWLRIRPTIIEFFDVENGQITQGRLTDEYDAVRQHSKNQSKKAKARWLKEKQTVDAVASSGQCPADASPSLTLTPIDPIPNGIDADGVVPSKNIDPKKVVYDQGKSLLRAYGIANGTAGGLITKWLKQHDPPSMMRVLLLAGEQERHDIVAFMNGALNNGISPETESERSAERVARVIEADRQRYSEDLSGGT